MPFDRSMSILSTVVASSTVASSLVRPPGFLSNSRLISPIRRSARTLMIPAAFTDSSAAFCDADTPEVIRHSAGTAIRRRYLASEVFGKVCHPGPCDTHNHKFMARYVLLILSTRLKTCLQTKLADMSGSVRRCALSEVQGFRQGLRHVFRQGLRHVLKPCINSKFRAINLWLYVHAPDARLSVRSDGNLWSAPACRRWRGFPPIWWEQPPPRRWPGRHDDHWYQRRARDPSLATGASHAGTARGIPGDVRTRRLCRFVEAILVYFTYERLNIHHDGDTKMSDDQLRRGKCDRVS